MIKPLLQDEEFLADVQRARNDTANLHLWWLGQSGFLLQWAGRHLLLDPYLSDSLVRKYAQTDKPHVRMTEIIVAPERLDFVDVVTSSHAHTDHFDPDTLGPLLRANPNITLVVPEANRAMAAERLRRPPEAFQGMVAGQSVAADGFLLHAVPAAHNDLEVDEHGHHKFLGYVIEAGPWIVYHSGDTLRYEGLTGWLTRRPISIALLPINGNLPERRVAGNFSGLEAAQLAKDVQAQIVIPCHYEMFEFNTVSPDEFVKTAIRLKQSYRVLRCGERWSSAELRQVTSDE